MNSQPIGSEKANILIVDDTLSNLRLLANILTAQGYKVRGIPKGKRVLITCELSPPDLILLDIMMPDMDGYQVCEQLKASEKTCNIPVIFLSGLHEPLDKVKAFAVGGVDYITKPFQIEEVFARVENQLRLRSLQQQLLEQNEQLQKEIRERQLLEAMLRASEAEIRGFFEAMNDIVLLINADEHTIKVAPTTPERFYPKNTNVLGETIALFDGEQADKFYGQIRQVLATKKLLNFEYSLQLNDQLIWFSASIAPISENMVAWVARDISDRKKIEAALSQSKERFRTLVDNIPGVIYRCVNHGEWTMKFLSDAVAEMTGYPADHFIQNRVRTWMSITHPQDRAIVELTINQAIAAKKPYVLEYRILRADGRIRWVYEKGQGYFNSEGNLLWLDGAIFDITERKQQQEALQLIVEGTAAKVGREFFRACVRYLATVLNVRYALVTELIDNNCTQVRTLAFWIGETWSEDIEYDLSDTPCEQVLKGQYCFYPENLENCFPNDQELINMGVVSYLGIPLTDSTNRVLGHLAVLDVKPMVNDTSMQLILRIFAARAGAELERKLADEAVVKRAGMDNLISSISRAFLNQEIDSAIDFTLRVLGEYAQSDRSYITRYSNEQQTQWNMTHEWCADGIDSHSFMLQNVSIEAFPWLQAQLQQDQTIHLPTLDCLPPEATQDRNALTTLSIQSLINIPLTYQNKLVGCLGLVTIKTPKQWHIDTINLLKLVGEIIAIAFARQDAELARQQAAEAALAASKAKSEFLANMSHELRTPLTAIISLSEVLREQTFGNLNAKQQQKIATIERSGQHLLELINDVLDLAKIESGKMELEIAPTNIQDLCNASLAFVRQQAYQKNIHLNSQIPTGIDNAQIDERRMRQVLINLLSNAVKFTPEGGSVWIKVQAELENEVLQFSVVDTGIGIKQEDMNKLFQPFVQLDGSLNRRYTGTGLGLALVRQVIELHGGSVAVESKVDRGSRFTVSVPYKPQTSSVPSLKHPDRTISFTQILIIEYDTTAAERVSHYLSEIGINHCTINAGIIDIVEVAINFKPDAIVVAWQSSDCSNSDVFTQLRSSAQTQNIPVLIISAVEQPMPDADSVIYEHLVKPFSQAQFELALRNLAATKKSGNKLVQSPDKELLPFILLAEDNEATIATIVEYLEAQNYKMATAVTGVEAVQMTKTLKPDLVLMDIQMPEMDGIEATRQIRADAEVGRTPIIALTSLAMPGVREKCLEAGTNEYLAKPIRLKKLLCAIASHLPQTSPPES